MMDSTEKSSSPSVAPSGSSSTSSSSKRRQHRRAKKSRRQRSRPMLEGQGEEKGTLAKAHHHQRQRHTNTLTPPAAQISPSTSSRKRSGGRQNNHKHHSKRPKQVFLRPTNGPLLNAPKNSTQFIIDDHNRANADASCDVDDDEVYSERDFQSVYESAHREEISTWDRKRLCDEIAALERRQKELVGMLARVDPGMYLQRLQSELAQLQETNRALKEGIGVCDLPDSSTSEEKTCRAPETGTTPPAPSSTE